MKRQFLPFLIFISFSASALAENDAPRYSSPGNKYLSAVWDMFTYDFESECPKGKPDDTHNIDEIGNYWTSCAKTFSTEKPEAILKYEKIEEWMWINESIEDNIPKLKAREKWYEGLEKAIVSPEFVKGTLEQELEVEKTWQNLLRINELSQKLEQVWAWTNSCSSLGNSSCNIDENILRIKILTLERDRILNESPVLQLRVFEPWISDRDLQRKAKGDNWVGQIGKFRKYLKQGYKDAQKLVRDEISDLEKLKDDENELAKKIKESGNSKKAQVTYKEHIEDATKDFDLLQKLVLWSDPSMKAGLGQLRFAGCRLRQRHLGHLSSKDLHTIAINGALLGTGFFARRLLGIAGQLATVGRIGMYATQAGFMAADLLLLKQIHSRCETLKTAAVSIGEASTTDGTPVKGGIAKELRECNQKFNDTFGLSLLAWAYNAKDLTDLPEVFRSAKGQKVAIERLSKIRTNPSELEEVAEDASVAKRIIPSVEELRNQVAEVLTKKGLSKTDTQFFVKKLLLTDLKDPEVALELIQAIDPKKLNGKNALTVIPYTIRKMLAFHGREGIDIKLAKQILNSWDELELAGLAKSYDEAARLAKDLKPGESKIKTLEQAFKSQGIPEEEVKKLAKCIFLGV